ncbi:VOC family protein [Filobacillus milosensis]|uniref:VOC family protein n=1 Tax=Filobacillus milosensis TaxID=94137 RepID=A0A4Y8IHX3_9BACI|nr:VOC family protein [Filobacillus milosensis]TFB19219.1 VOC family protein [Filobacillus milosensis]
MSYHKLPTKYIEQISLNVSDITRSKEFYINKLGMKLLNEEDHKATLSFDNQTPAVELVQPENVVPLDRSKTGLFHVAFLVPSKTDLANVVYYLWKNQIPIQGASDHLVSEALYLQDPDGNGIEIYRDRPHEEWKWKNDHVVMDSVPLDVEGLLQERSETGWKGFPENTVIGHIHLQVHNLEEVRPFYEKLGFDIVAEYGPQALFMADNHYHHHIGLNVWNSRNGEKKHNNEIGLNWYSIQMTKEERKEIRKRLDIELSGGLYTVEDPSGIKIKF